MPAPDSIHWLITQNRLAEAEQTILAAEALAEKRIGGRLPEPEPVPADTSSPEGGFRLLFQGDTRRQLFLLGIIWFVYYADVVAVLEELDVTKVVLIEHSMGGPVALEAVLRSPDYVVGVVGAEAFFDNWTAVDLQPFKENFSAATNSFVRNTMFMPGSNSELVEKVAADMASADAKVGIGTLDGLMKWALDNQDEQP